MPSYQFKRFRRTGDPESTTGELLSCQVIEASGLAYAEKMLGPDLRKSILGSILLLSKATPAS
jgi:hypothetical protein